MGGNQNPQMLLEECEMGRSGGSSKVKHGMSSERALPPLGVYPEEMEIYCSDKNLNTDVHGSIIHISQKRETAKMPINWQTHKQRSGTFVWWNSIQP